VYDLEKKGGSIIGGVIKILQEKKLNPPPPPRNPALPPKPKGQTVGSFRRGLRTLPDAMAAKLGSAVRTSWPLTELSKDGDLYRLVYDTPQGRKELRARSVALTVPAYVAGDLLQQQCPSAAAALKVRQGARDGKCLCSRRACSRLQSLHPTFEPLLHTLRICAWPSLPLPVLPFLLLQAFDYPPVGAITLAYPESAVRSDRLDAAGNLPGGQMLRGLQAAVQMLRCREPVMLHAAGGRAQRRRRHAVLTHFPARPPHHACPPALLPSLLILTLLLQALASCTPAPRASPLWAPSTAPPSSPTACLRARCVQEWASLARGAAGLG
jgi:hypothetical protein